MKERKQFALNKLFNFSILLGLLFLGLSIELFLDNDNVWGIGLGVASLICIVPALLFTPYCYVFDSKGVSLCYVFLPVERYLWKDIHSIEVENVRIAPGKSTTLLDAFFAYVFCIRGKNVGRTRFYMNGCIRKSFRTKRLLEKHWDGTITGYFFEDVKKWYSKRKTKKQAQIEAHFTDEIVVMEREIRAEVRDWLDPLIPQAKQYDLVIKPKYFYITKDYKELNSRPEEGYTYTLVAEIARPGETDENRIVVLSIDLLYVRLGKTAYRGVKNECAREELEVTVKDVLCNGIEAYCKNNK